MSERAIEIFHDGHAVFIHRDYNPGNVLWTRHAISGIVDWQTTSVGPPSVDVGHCRSNLLRYGQPVVEWFTTLWEQASGTSITGGLTSSEPLAGSTISATSHPGAAAAPRRSSLALLPPSVTGRSPSGVARGLPVGPAYSSG
jgi:hypothetical protein